MATYAGVCQLPGACAMRCTNLQTCGDRAHIIVIPRILAIDFGTKRMGLAVSDALGMTAQGLPTLQRTRIADDLERLRSLVEEYSVELVLVGNPIGHSGGETSMSQLCRGIRGKTSPALALPGGIARRAPDECRSQSNPARSGIEHRQTAARRGPRGGRAAPAKLSGLPRKRA